MFPIAHNLMVKKMLESDIPPFNREFSPFEIKLLNIGSILPDFVIGMGMDRDYGHRMGEEFYEYTEANCPEYSALALGVWLHGIDGFGFDTYADEKWKDEIGWCFLTCLLYIPKAINACALPREFALWKSHNLVELMAELECAKYDPKLGKNLLEAIHDQEVMKVVTDILVDFGGAKAERVYEVLKGLDDRFSISEVTAHDCAEKYIEQLKRRHSITGGSVRALADLILQIQIDHKEDFWLWFEEVEGLIKEKFSKRNL